MNLTIAAHAGFCFGVRRAVAGAEELLNAGVCLYTLGPVIHNPQEVERLGRMGARQVDAVDDVPPGSHVMIRAHGAGRAVHEALQARGCVIHDRACPFVQRIHALVDRAAAEGQQVLVVGDGSHPEVQGILGWSRGRGVAVQSL